MDLVVVSRELFILLVEKVVVLFCPPVLHVAVLVKLSALGVERVRDLVSDRCTEFCVKLLITHVLIAHDPFGVCAEDVDAVGLRIVCAVCGLRRRLPPCLVDRMRVLFDFLCRKIAVDRLVSFPECAAFLC